MKRIAAWTTALALLGGCDQDSGRWQLTPVAPDTGTYGKFHAWKVDTATGAVQLCSIDKAYTRAIAPECTVPSSH
jgi:hypothetical protein